MDNTCRRADISGRDAYSRIISVLLVLFSTLVISCAASFIVFGMAESVVENTSFVFFPTSSVPFSIFESLRAAVPELILIIALFFTTFSLFSEACGVIIALIRGVSLGCVLRLSVSGALSLPSPSAGIAFYLVSTTVLLVFAAYSSVYSRALLSLKSDCGESEYSGYFGCIAAEYFRLTLALGGCAIIPAAISRILFRMK